VEGRSIAETPDLEETLADIAGAIRQVIDELRPTTDPDDQPVSSSFSPNLVHKQPEFGISESKIGKSGIDDQRWVAKCIHLAGVSLSTYLTLSKTTLFLPPEGLG